jgi:hypothetical protein
MLLAIQEFVFLFEAVRFAHGFEQANKAMMVCCPKELPRPDIDISPWSGRLI